MYNVYQSFVIVVKNGIFFEFYLFFSDIERPWKETEIIFEKKRFGHILSFKLMNLNAPFDSQHVWRNSGGVCRLISKVEA